MKTLVTGSAGFIGSNLVKHLLEAHSELQILSLDKLTYAGSLNNLESVKDHPRHTFIQGDICNDLLLKELFEEYQIHSVIHLAAESHVDKSIDGPKIFIESNILGTFQLLEAARNLWMADVQKLKSEFSESRFHHISSDEVYGHLGEEGKFTESSNYNPSSPYSASKAASDHLVRAHHRTYGLPTLISNCSNNYGPHQHAEKLIPTILRKALSDNPIPIYGDGSNVRDWLYVEDHCRAIDLIFSKAKVGETYNVGANNELKNLDLCKKLCTILDQKKPRADGKSYAEQIQFVVDRPGHDFRYAIDATKLQKELGFEARTSLDEGLRKTVEAYLARLP